jgi:pre-mRNA processing factor 3 (PRP3)
MYLTKKERKRIRKTAREERERDKRDKMMMDLLPAPEPKFKLSNFMKVLGDQAIAGKKWVVECYSAKRRLFFLFRCQYFHFSG